MNQRDAAARQSAAKLEVRDLRLAYGDNPILKGVSFGLAAGEVVALLGASGSGKTTLLRAVAGLEQPNHGQILLDGNKALFDAAKGIELPAEKRDLGLVFQSYALWPHRTVQENVAYGLKLRGIDKGESAERVQQALDNLNLGHLGQRYPHQLSGGQQQRVAIARALVYNPPVILLDEPLSNLDAALRLEARAWLRELIIRLKLSALVVTHDQSEAMAMADRILLLKDGKIEQAGTPQELYGQPRSLYAADFMGSNNRLVGQVVQMEGGLVRVEGEGWSLWGDPRTPVKVGDPVTALIRLERVRPVSGAGDNRLAVKPVTGMYLGDRWELLCESGALRLRAFGEENWQVGHDHLELPSRHVWVFAGQG
ncbi:ABC transporter ATP-binding protein [Leeia aquatica]|uniref:ABC transporter ATP-binding protein n=1 Tax=Leeia aquatica TaxID=2725557 RepID=A0A847RXK7_9NEIS|nr:ABC transporter ATP-binding protein [Leeia aquatica]NLR75890.1 ABC transporter ATP-binding protein [Leeia aquatica]